LQASKPVTAAQAPQAQYLDRLLLVAVVVVVGVKLLQRREPEVRVGVAPVQMELVGQVKTAVQIQVVAEAAVKVRFLEQPLA
jgi:hypothetical protein